jgi:hypothetical protein
MQLINLKVEGWGRLNLVHNIEETNLRLNGKME